LTNFKNGVIKRTYLNIYQDNLTDLNFGSMIAEL
jgi:hypothetical protein